MSSFRQIEANRRNSQRSTGPKTEEGKRRSRRNAMRHGLCAETVIEVVEDIEDYREFESAILADFDAETAVQRELVLRLASLLWRIRRATSIETDLLRFQAEIVRKRRPSGRTRRPATSHYLGRLNGYPPEPNNDLRNHSGDDNGFTENQAAERDCEPRLDTSVCRDLAHAFQRLNNLDNGAFERVGRYELALWRQIAQLLFVLRPRRRRP